MARRARLSPERDAQTHWPWHSVKSLALPASALFDGDRRMEAENYLSGGYGHRLALSARIGAAGVLGASAKVWQPSRLKGTIVEETVGTPFLAATQVFDLRPVARKFLALEKTDNNASRFVSSGTILVTRSGTVGRATLSTDAQSKTLISDDLLRIEASSPDLWGWLYAFLRAPAVRQMMSSAQYGHIIKHLEPNHLTSLPMPTPTAQVASKFQETAKRILDDRNKAERCFRAADEAFAAAVGERRAALGTRGGFIVSATSLSSGRRRFEANFHEPSIRSLWEQVARQGLRTMSLVEAGYNVWLPNRFKRVPAAEGVELVGSSDLFEISPDIKKRIVDVGSVSGESYRVKAGWLLLARSGQTYGLNGNLVIANAFHEGKIVSDHVIRLAARCDKAARPGYVYTALSHPTLGRPVVKSLAYGSSIPEIEVADVAGLSLVRLAKDAEDKIADVAEEGSRLFADADLTERRMGDDAGKLLDQLIDGDWSSFVPFGNSSS